MLIAADAKVDPSCRVTSDVDINPHTAGLGSVAASSIRECCAVCRSSHWWKAGCRFSTLSRGRCWLKADNRTVARSPGKMSVECLGEARVPKASLAHKAFPWCCPKCFKKGTAALQKMLLAPAHTAGQKRKR